MTRAATKPVRVSAQDTVDHSVYTIPLFALAILSEAVLLRARGKARYLLPDTLSNLGCALGSLLVSGYIVTAGAYLYDLTYQMLPHVSGLWHSEARNILLRAVVAALAVDFVVYLEHRVSHRVYWMWAIHAVHHQSEAFNFSVGLRINWLRNPMLWIFALPLAALGLPLPLFLSARLVNDVYQFFLHTQTVGTLGKLEYVFNTPSHHRVHHGINASYQDKNFGGILIIWDRLFGTFVREDAPVVFGITTPVGSFSPLRGHLQQWQRLAAACAALPGWRRKLQLWWMPPGWAAGELLRQERRKHGTTQFPRR